MERFFGLNIWWNLKILRDTLRGARLLNRMLKYFLFYGCSKRYRGKARKKHERGVYRIKTINKADASIRSTGFVDRLKPGFRPTSFAPLLIAPKGN